MERPDIENELQKIRRSIQISKSSRNLVAPVVNPCNYMINMQGQRLSFDKLTCQIDDTNKILDTTSPTQKQKEHAILMKRRSNILKIGEIQKNSRNGLLKNQKSVDFIERERDNFGGSGGGVGGSPGAVGSPSTSNLKITNNKLQRRI